MTVTELRDQLQNAGEDAEIKVLTSGNKLESVNVVQLLSTEKENTVVFSAHGEYKVDDGKDG